MNFEKIEIYGFKSFADKAEIKFENGITGIVGPNGCGKSNVADAIRWVLGEQSAKSLRGSSMQDVIFSGTQGRKSLSYCEVSLYFDNTNRMFSIDYNEVIITRKLFKSGESEYYINKQPARLRDIIELLHECGINKEGYTIIGQGKVEEIMNAKPEDRRRIFEEATGIAAVKTKKDESERKLERTRENLVRLNDIISEIENQLGPLTKKAEKAKEYIAISEELKHHELNTYIAKVDGVASAKEKINLKIKGIDEQTELRKREIEDADKEHNKVLSGINDADDKLKGLNDELTQKLIGMERSSGASQMYDQKISYLRSQIERANGERQENEKLIGECKSSIKMNKENIASSQIQLGESEKTATSTNDKIMDLTNRIALGEELADANRKKIIESIENLTSIKVNEGTMSIEKSNLLAKLEELTAKLDELSVKRDKLFNDKEACDNNINILDRAVFDLKNNISSKEDEVRSDNESVDAVRNKILSLNAAVTELSTKANFYRALNENYDGYTFAAKTLLNKAKTDAELGKRITGVVAKLITNDKKYDLALEMALGASAQHIVTPTLNDATYLIEYLKRNNYGRVTFLPVNTVKPREENEIIVRALREKGALGLADEIVSYDASISNVISALLGNTLVVDNVINAKEIGYKYGGNGKGFPFKMVTLDGEVFLPQGSVSGGSKKEASGLLSSDRRLEDAQKALDEKKAELESYKLKKEEQSKKADKALDDLALLNEMYNDKRQQIVIEREKLSVAENGLVEIGKEIERNNDLIDEIKLRVKQLDKDYDEVTTGGKKLEEDKVSARKNADKHQAEFDELKKERDALITSYTDLQVKITELKGKLTSLTADNERLNGVIKDAENEIKNIDESNINAEKIIEELLKDKEKIALTKEERDEVEKVRAEIDNMENYKKELREQLAKTEELRKSLADAVTELSERRHNREIELTKIDTDLEYLSQSIWEDYQADYNIALKFKVDGYDAAFGEAEINRLRKRRSQLGSVNPGDIDDCKLMQERYDDLKKQSEDIMKAEADLNQAIDKIKAEMLKQFDEGFVKINENFQKIFKELFGGGKAMLQLDYANADDKLEAGIEIIAEPPGKRLQKLSLLSGGEKALTAIAILFSILKLRPMPFCVLDEIEAALDEANVDRFARYLRKFSQDTQFIVITHKKPTMEMADSLFGVTMQEKGVSKMVSVKLADIQDIQNP